MFGNDNDDYKLTAEDRKLLNEAVFASGEEVPDQRIAALESEVAEKDKHIAKLEAFIEKKTRELLDQRAKIAELEFIAKEQLSRLTALTEGITEATGKEGTTAILTHIGRLEAENAELRADAERYRWLREQVEKAHLVIAEVGGWDELESWSGDDPDGMIDLAMSQRAEQQDGRE